VKINDSSIAYGFEVSGSNLPAGLLIRNSQTFGVYPDGGPRCDYGQMVADGGKTVTFPNGIRGVWDTFTQAPCVNGGLSCGSGAGVRDAGTVPGVGSPYVYVLEPMDCANDFAGAVVTP